MSRTWRALTVVACVALLAGACNKGKGPSAAKGTQGPAVAHINGQPVTQSYFEQRLEKMDRRFLPDTLDTAGKRKFLDFIINKELMAQKAEELKYGDDPRVVSAMQTYGDNLAGNQAIEEISKAYMQDAVFFIFGLSALLLFQRTRTALIQHRFWINILVFLLCITGWLLFLVSNFSLLSSPFRVRVSLHDLLYGRLVVPLHFQV